MAEEETKTEVVEEVEQPTTAQDEDAGRGLRYQKTKAVCRRCRRLGVKLFLKGERCFSPKCSFVRRKYAPGQHGQSRKRLSDYGQQLQAKQMIAETYGLTDRLFRKIYEKASQTPESTKEKLAEILELRLDNVLYQAGMALSRRHAKQLVGHGKIKVNKTKVSSPSYQLSEKDIIKVEQKKLSETEQTALKRIKAEKKVPSWLSVSKNNQIEVKKLPEDIAERLGFDFQLVIEFYSR